MRIIRWDLYCLPNDMIEQTRAKNCLEVQLAAHEIKLGCTPQSGNHLARDWKVETVP